MIHYSQQHQQPNAAAFYYAFTQPLLYYQQQQQLQQQQQQHQQHIGTYSTTVDVDEFFVKDDDEIAAAAAANGSNQITLATPLSLASAPVVTQRKLKSVAATDSLVALQDLERRLLEENRNALLRCKELSHEEIPRVRLMLQRCLDTSPQSIQHTEKTSEEYQKLEDVRRTLLSFLVRIEQLKHTIRINQEQPSQPPPKQAVVENLLEDAVAALGKSIHDVQPVVARVVASTTTEQQPKQKKGSSSSGIKKPPRHMHNLIIPPRGEDLSGFVRSDKKRSKNTAEPFSLTPVSLRSSPASPPKKRRQHHSAKIATNEEDDEE